MLSCFTPPRPLDEALAFVIASFTSVRAAVGEANITSHCVRVGTCTTLLKLGLAEAQVKLWAGWVP